MSIWNWGDKSVQKSPKRQADEYDAINGEYGVVIRAGRTDNKEFVEDKLSAEGVDKIFEVVAPRDNQLFIDYDTPDLPARFEEAMKFLVQTFCDFGQRLTYKITQSRHGNLHVMIDLPRDISELERLAWHGVFGSDWKRDASSLMCMRRGVSNNVLLIERRDTPPLATGARMFRRDTNGHPNEDPMNDPPSLRD